MSSVLQYPHVTEKAMNKMDFENKLQFIVDTGAGKDEIAAAIEQQFDVSIVDVNTMVTMKGEKKATVTLSEEDDAEEIASRIGVF
ncbi:50S ribosomal protein L23 [Halorientalis regularis]|jgi:large subunit ribosomal protein L23|uniref:Large ribosomal subunit protein uL23 n=1 Tax=Halorientalis regularis TaxID=660518 RepID=A0A1G7I395_9EURY|nr:50S ribosomal protein L23 [Halorientalis regularis]SDF07267.1 LSU ribosomal protein L23P [Halorientalis regularis]